MEHSFANATRTGSPIETKKDKIIEALDDENAASSDCLVLRISLQPIDMDDV